MTVDEIQALLALQELDLKLLEYETHRASLPRLLQAIEEPLAAARAKKEQVEAELALARSQHRHFELELVTNNERFKKIQTQQMGVRNQIEYEAFQHEMESLKDRADSLEESGLKWIERLDEAQERLPALVQELEEQDKIAEAKRRELDAKTAELKRIHDEASVLCAPHLAKIPANVSAAPASGIPASMITRSAWATASSSSGASRRPGTPRSTERSNGAIIR